MDGGLPVRTEAGGVRTGRQGMGGRERVLAGAEGVVGERAMVGRIPLGQHGERTPVELASLGRRQGRRHGLPGELVPEGDARRAFGQDAALEALVDRIEAASRDRGEKSGGHGRRQDGGGRGHLGGVRREPGGAGEDRVPDGGRQVVGAGGEHLGDEEGVALRAGVKADGVDAQAGAFDQCGDAVRGERRHDEAVDVGEAGEVAQQWGQGVSR